MRQRGGNDGAKQGTGKDEMEERVTRREQVGTTFELASIVIGLIDLVQSIS